MPYAPHYRVSALGRLGTSGERFSYSVNMAPDGNDNIPGLSPNADVWTDVANEVAGFHSAPEMLISGYAILEEVKIANIGPDGKYVEDAIIVNITDTPGGIGSSPGVDYVTPQAAWAMSLVTARRGATGRGRFYLPMPTTPCGSGFQVATNVRDAAETRLVQFIEDLGNQPGFDVLDLRVVVASTLGYNSTVTGVRIGRVIDTVRSRRRSIVEDYQVTSPVNQGE